MQFAIAGIGIRMNRAKRRFTDKFRDEDVVRRYFLLKLPMRKWNMLT
jgi:hypothetical protein